MGMMYFQNALNYQLQDNCKPKAEKKKNAESNSQPNNTERNCRREHFEEQ